VLIRDSLKISKVVATIQMGILKIDEKNVKKNYILLKTLP